MKGMSEYEKEMYREIEARLTQQEQEGYDLGKPFNKWDWLFAGLTALLGFAIIIYGLI